MWIQIHQERQYYLYKLTKIGGHAMKKRNRGTGANRFPRN